MNNMPPNMYESDKTIVAYLGPEASFCHQAARYLFKDESSFKAAKSIEEIFELVSADECPYGVIPIENSYEGSVNATMDLFYRHDLIIASELSLRVHHQLLSVSKNIGDIKNICSHPMAIAQCRLWLKANLAGVPVTETASTSLAASLAVKDPGLAAIAGRLSGRTYNLNILAEDIEDHPDNITRFFMINKKATKPTGHDKTSLLFFLKHQPGALYHALAGLAEHGVNMTRIESRPMKIRNWEYMFFMDIEGHEHNSDVGEALKRMEKACVLVKRLGSYPAGGEPVD